MSAALAQPDSKNFLDVLLSRPATPQPIAPADPLDTPPARTSPHPYVEAALRAELDRVRNAPAGQRNQDLNIAALALGKYVGGGWLDRGVVRAALGAADTRPGDDGRVAWATIDSGLTAGESQPHATLPEPAMRERAPWETSQPAGTDTSTEASTWASVDLGPFLDGTRDPLVPDLMARSDGQCLLYPGAVHSFHGESESGKSLLLQLLAADLVNDGEPVLFVDFESDPAAIVDRMLTLGAEPDQLRAHFRYVQPEVRPDASQADRDAWTALLAHQYRLAIVDGVTDALAVFGYGTKENDEITAWMRSVPKAIAARTGATVVIIDHVTKDTEGRGRFAIGGQAKMSGLTGAAYTVSIVEPLGRGVRGVIALRIGKDRPGQIRPACGPFRKSDRTQEAARVIIDDTVDGPTVWELQPWQAPGADKTGREGFRPTALMERVSRYIEDNPEATRHDVRSNVTGRTVNVLTALDALVDEGHITVSDGAKNAKLHTLARCYRQTDDPRSDVFRPGTTQPDEAMPEAA